MPTSIFADSTTSARGIIGAKQSSSVPENCRDLERVAHDVAFEAYSQMCQ